MSIPTMAPLVVDGVPRPDLDNRWVPLATMALYEGVSRWTVYQRALAGQYPVGGTRMFGTRQRYKPAVCMAAAVSP